MCIEWVVVQTLIIVYVVSVPHQVVAYVLVDVHLWHRWLSIVWVKLSCSVGLADIQLTMLVCQRRFWFIWILIRFFIFSFRNFIVVAEAFSLLRVFFDDWQYVRSLIQSFEHARCPRPQQLGLFARTVAVDRVLNWVFCNRNRLNCWLCLIRTFFDRFCRRIDASSDSTTTIAGNGTWDNFTFTLWVASLELEILWD